MKDLTRLKLACYNNDTTVIELHFLLITCPLPFLPSTTVATFHLATLIFILCSSISILLDIQIPKFKVPFTYCEFFTHITLLLCYIIFPVPAVTYSPSQFLQVALENISLVIMWSLLLLILIIIALEPSQNVYVSVQRKTFHFVAAGIYTLGLRQAEIFSSTTFHLRRQLFPKSSISKLFRRYCDCYQDPKMSYGYPAFLLLYINTIPLLFLKTNYSEFAIASIITVDVGDAIAAIIGSYFGKYFPIVRCGNKSVLGTIAFIVSSLLAGLTVISAMSVKKHRTRAKIPQFSVFDGLDDPKQTDKGNSEDAKRNKRYNHLSGTYEKFNELFKREAENANELGSWTYCPIEPQQIKVEPTIFIEKMLFDFQ
ncbi:dolichol kinase [Entamoeba marina]